MNRSPKVHHNKNFGIFQSCIQELLQKPSHYSWLIFDYWVDKMIITNDLYNYGFGLNKMKKNA